MRKNLINIVQIIAFLSIGFILAWLSLKNIQISELFLSFQSLNKFWVLTAVALGGLSHVIRAYRWNILLETIGYKPRIFNSTASIYISYLSNLAVPRLGEIVRCSIMLKYEKIPIQKSLGTVVSDRIIDIICLFGFTVLAFIWEYNIIADFFLEQIFNPMIEKTDPLTHNLVLVIGLIIFLAWIGWIAIKLLKKISTKLWDLFLGFKNGLLSVTKLRKPLLFIVLTVIMWTFYFLQVFVIYQAYSELQVLGVGSALVVFVFGSLAMIVTPGGIGAYPKFVGETLSLYGISTFTGVSFGWFTWMLQTFFIIVIGMVFIVLLPFVNKSKDGSLEFSAK